MPGIKVSAGGPAQTLALLWGSHEAISRNGLSIRGIVAAATDLADAEGLVAVSMRRVADRLGSPTMSLYSHVPGKAELTALMADSAAGELYPDVDAPARQPGGWRGGVTFIAERNWHLYNRHPWLLEIGGDRSLLGPNISLKYEAELRAIDGIGLTDIEMDAVMTLVLTHVEGTARAQIQHVGVQKKSGQSDAQWWEEFAPLLEKVMNPNLFPVSGRVGQAAGEAHQAASNPLHAFTFGLERILDGVANLLADRA